jgi:hypothetical protein
MARFGSIQGLLKALGLASWRDVQSFRSIGGQNFLLFVGFVGLQPESAQFFLLILALVLLFPLSSDPMQKIPRERRDTWPIVSWEWITLRVCSLALSPVAWFATFLLLRAGWRTGALALGCGISAQILLQFWKAMSRSIPTTSLNWIPAPPGVIGAIMRLQSREMLRTLDLYVALLLVASTELYRVTGGRLDPDALRIISLVTTLALSTHTQVLLGIDGSGAERYRQVPIRGWQILLAKDLAFLSMLGLLVMPLDLLSGIMGGIAALAIGHHRSVLNPVRQAPWKFTSGALVPDGLIQTVTLFGVGSAAKTAGLPLIGLCVLVWLASLFFYGWWWDRSKLS